MQKKTESNRNDRDNAEKDLRLNVWTFLFVVIGFVASWVNMTFIQDAPRSIEVLAFLSIIFTTMIPGIIIALVNRYWGYGYLIGFAIAGIPFLIIVDLFIGGYTFATTLFIFIILWLIFWKAWRSLSSIRTGSLEEGHLQ
ncbi:MAG: hypothetical protein E3J90_10835 [Promethearchaeota archaeon]|nr:MAG: hypothetical protein E3J90_10835 [Candidatus Lokiarchaeota archaeon]